MGRYLNEEYNQMISEECSRYDCAYCKLDNCEHECHRLEDVQMEEFWSLEEIHKVERIENTW